MLWVKTLHILFVISWFAGLFYLPRIYVNLAQNQDPAARLVLIGMAHRLYKFMTPLAILAIIFGLILWLWFGIGKNQIWLYGKLLMVTLIIIYHLLCLYHLRTFISGTNQKSHKYFRWFNELPVLGLLLILILVVVKPF